MKRRDFTINGLLLDPEKLFPQGLKPIVCEEPDVRAEARTLQGEAITHSAQDDSSITTQHTMRSAVMDFVGGVGDLDAGVVRAIGRAEQRFEEDHLRMLRGVRFAARFGFEVEAGTKAAMRGLAAQH